MESVEEGLEPKAADPESDLKKGFWGSTTRLLYSVCTHVNTSAVNLLRAAVSFCWVNSNLKCFNPFAALGWICSIFQCESCLNCSTDRLRLRGSSLPRASGVIPHMWLAIVTFFPSAFLLFSHSLYTILCTDLLIAEKLNFFGINKVLSVCLSVHLSICLSMHKAQQSECPKV